MPAPITTTSKGGPPEFIASSHVLHTKRPMRSTVKDVCSKAMTIIASWALQFRRERGLVYRAPERISGAGYSVSPLTSILVAISAFRPFHERNTIMRRELPRFVCTSNYVRGWDKSCVCLYSDLG